MATSAVAALALFCCVAAPGVDEALRGLSVQAAQAAQLNDYDPDRLHALIIGINEYEKGWPLLRCARPDAEAVAAVLRDQYAFGDVRLIVDGAATRTGVLAALDACHTLGENESLLIYYAGHGWMDPQTQSGYWIPVEAAENDKHNYIAVSYIVSEYLKKYRVKHLLVLADSCFSGTLLRGGTPVRDKWSLPVGYSKPSRLILTSGDLAPVLDSAGDDHSPFATRLLQFLSYNDADVFGVLDVYVSIRGELQTSPVCEPLDTVNHVKGGEFVFVRARHGRPGDHSLPGPDAPVVVAPTPSSVPSPPVPTPVPLVLQYVTRDVMAKRGAKLDTGFEGMADRFTKNPDGTVDDKCLGVVWLGSPPSAELRRCEDAITYCKSLGEGWRLPTVDELKTLVTQTSTKGLYIDSRFFSVSTTSPECWTATREKILFGSPMTLVVNFQMRVVKSTSDETYLQTLPVRPRQ